jgi:hypothetical protein
MLARVAQGDNKLLQIKPGVVWLVKIQYLDSRSYGQPLILSAGWDLSKKMLATQFRKTDLTFQYSSGPDGPDKYHTVPVEIN